MQVLDALPAAMAGIGVTRLSDVVGTLQVNRPPQPTPVPTVPN
jgi:hypothetical protein